MLCNNRSSDGDAAPFMPVWVSDAAAFDEILGRMAPAYIPGPGHGLQFGHRLNWSAHSTVAYYYE
jgi:hypothetical protein